MDIKTVGGGSVNAKDVMAYRVSTLEETGKPIGWHRHGSENDDQPAVYQKHGINFKEGQAARDPDGEWSDVAKEFAEEFVADKEGLTAEEVLKHLETADSRPGSKSGMKKSDYEEIGCSVVGEVVAGASQNENAEEDYHTTLEWANFQIEKLLEESTFLPDARPAKPKPTLSAVSKERERAIAEMRANGISEDVIAKVYPSE